MEPYLDVGQVDDRIEALHILHELWGGHFIKMKRRNPKHRQASRWRTQGYKVVEACEEMLPYLVVKHALANIILEFGKTMKGKHGNKGNKITEDVLNKRRDLKSLIHLVNNKGGDTDDRSTYESAS